MGIPEKIKAIQDEIGRTQLNKATEHHVGLLKAKIAKLKREQEAVQIKKSSKKSDGFDVRRTGDATVVIIGLPSVGKSTLLNALTGSKSTVGAFQFTTVTVVPGVLDYRGAKYRCLIYQVFSKLHQVVRVLEKESCQLQEVQILYY